MGRIQIRFDLAWAVCVFGVAATACDTPRVIDRLPDTSGQIGGPRGQLLDEHLKRLAGLGFWGDYVVVDSGEVLVHKGYGWRDREARTPIDNETIFDVGSIAKVFTAILTLDLEEDGLLSLDDSVGRFYPDAPPDKASIKVRQLLSHTGGLATYHDVGVSHLDRQEALDRILAAPLEHTPGTAYSYSNSGYTLLALIVEAAAHDEFRHLVEARILAPAHMAMTGWQGDAQWRANGAVGYFAGHRRSNVADIPGSWTVEGAGTIASNPSDLFQLDRALKTGIVLDSTAQWAMYDTWDGVETPVRLDDAGMGWRVWRSPRGTTVVEKGGHTGDDAFNAVFRRYIGEDRAIIIALNTEDFSLGGLGAATWLTSRIHRFLTGDHQALPPSPDRGRLLVAGIEGSYGSDAAGRAEIQVVEGRTVLQASGQPLINLLLDVSGDLERRLETANHTSLALVTDIQRGSVPDSLLASGLAAYLRSELDGWFKPSGSAPDTVEVLGSTPEWLQDSQGVTSYVRVGFADGTRVRRLHWDRKGRLLGVGGGALADPVIDLVVRTDGDQIIAHHLALARNALLWFDETGLEVRTNKRSLHLARR